MRITRPQKPYFELSRTDVSNRERIPSKIQHDAADEVRHKEHRAEQVRALDAARERIGHDERQQVDRNQRHQREQRRVPECVHKARVLKGLDVVVEADELPVARDFKAAQRQKRALQERVQESHAERRERRQQEQPCHALDRAADQPGIEGGCIPAAFSLHSANHSLSIMVLSCLRRSGACAAGPDRAPVRLRRHRTRLSPLFLIWNGETEGGRKPALCRNTEAA